MIMMQRMHRNKNRCIASITEKYLIEITHFRIQRRSENVHRRAKRYGYYGGAPFCCGGGGSGFPYYGGGGSNFNNDQVWQCKLCNKIDFLQKNLKY